MTLLGLVAGLAVSGVRFGVAAWARQGDAGAAAMEMRIVQKFVRELTASAETVRVRDGSREPPALFRGERERLVLTSRLPSRLAAPALQLIEIRRIGDSLRLRRASLGDRAPAVAAGDFERRAAEEILLDDVKQVTFRYFGAARAGAAPSWSSEWRPRARTPELIEMSVILTNDDAQLREPRRWAPFIARVGGARLGAGAAAGAVD